MIVLSFSEGGEDPRIATWHKLEEMRMQKLGLGTKFSRHFNVCRRSLGTPRSSNSRESSPERRPATTADGRALALLHPKAETFSHQTYGLTRARKVNVNGKTIIVNSLAPFYSLGKPTCGYFFSRNTENRKVDFGIPASDLVQWRNFASSTPR